MLKAALIETGEWGEVHLAQLLRLKHEGEIDSMGVSDPDPAHRRFLAKLGIPVYETPEEMLDECEPDFVAIATDVSSRPLFVEKVLRRGVSVFCDRPAASTVEEIDAMINARDCSTASFALVAFESVYTRSLQTIKAIILSRCYGALRSVHVIGAIPCGDSHYHDNVDAGKIRAANGSPVYDSPLTNTFAQYLNFALFCLGRLPDGAARVLSVEGELLRAREDIENFDSCLLAYETDAGVPLRVALSHATATTIPAEVVFRFEHAVLRWSYHGWSVEDLEGHVLRKEDEDDSLDQAYTSIARLAGEGVPTRLVCSLEAARESVAAAAMAQASLPVRVLGRSEVRVCPRGTTWPTSSPVSRTGCGRGAREGNPRGGRLGTTALRPRPPLPARYAIRRIRRPFLPGRLPARACRCYHRIR